MALWQFKVAFIPTAWAVKNGFNSSALYSEDGYETEHAWKDNQPTTEIKPVLGEVLSPAELLDDETLYWGDEKGHDICAWYEDDVLGGIQFRLDLNEKADLTELVLKVVRAAETLSCVLFIPELRLIAEASEIELNKAIESSNALKYVRNPYQFLSGR